MPATGSEGVAPDIFQRFPLAKKSPGEIAALMAQPENLTPLEDYLTRFARRRPG
ncbi:MAG: hypothetical protein ACKVPY_03595 [Paracoccaceae bacterium]